jgi:hypothetical protein
VLGARLLFAVALGAYVKRGVWIVVASQVARQIWTPCAELDSHLPPSEVSWRTSPSHAAVDEAQLRFLLPGLPAGIANIWFTLNRIVRIGARLEG